MRNRPNHDARRDVRRPALGVGLAGALTLAGCALEHKVDVEPTEHTVKIEPIYMTVDINLRIQRELDDFYEDVVGGSGAEPEPEQEAPPMEGEEP